MGKINVGRVILCGIIAAVIINLVEDVMNGVFLGAWWNAVAASMNQHPFTVGQIVLFNIWGLVIGLTVAWIYAGFRPRFGAGHHTAIIAGITTWVLAYFCGYFAWAITGYPVSLMIVIGIVGFFEIIVASFIGNYFYREA